jgi:hypothetical protein
MLRSMLLVPWLPESISVYFSGLFNSSVASPADADAERNKAAMIIADLGMSFTFMSGLLQKTKTCFFIITPAPSLM